MVSCARSCASVSLPQSRNAERSKRSPWELINSWTSKDSAAWGAEPRGTSAISYLCHEPPKGSMTQPNRRIHGASACRPQMVGTSRCDVPARVRAGGAKVVEHALGHSFPSPDAALGDGERRSTPSLPKCRRTQINASALDWESAPSPRTASVGKRPSADLPADQQFDDAAILEWRSRCRQSPQPQPAQSPRCAN